MENPQETHTTLEQVKVLIPRIGIQSSKNGDISTINEQLELVEDIILKDLRLIFEKNSIAIVGNINSG